MKRIILSISAVMIAKAMSAQFTSATPPVAPKKDHVRTMHGDTVPDPYYWMYDYFGKGADSTLVVDYLKKENDYTETVMKETVSLQEQLYKEIRSRIKEKDEGVPVFKNGYYYYNRTETGKQYFKYCRKKGSLTAPEEILLDVDKMAEGKAFMSIGDIAISENNNLLAYAVDEVSRRQYKIYIKDLTTGKLLKDVISNTEGDPVWASDNRTIFYTEKHPVTLLSEKIRRHTLGTDASKDPVVYEEKDKANYIGVYKSKNNRYIFIVSQQTLSSELRYISASQPSAEFKIFAPRMPNVLYSVYPTDDRFFIRTNKDGAKNFKIAMCPLDKTDAPNWKTIIFEDKDVLIQSVSEFKNHLVISERKKGLAQFRIRDLSVFTDHYVDFGEPTYAASFAANPEYTTKKFNYNFNSLTTPSSVYEYDLEKRTKKLLKQQEVIGGYNASDYISERVFATADDGTSIPVSVVYKKDFKKDGSHPVLLYGYGSYGSSTDATFSISRLSLLNRGFAFAIAHIRGGQELGRQWYEDGKMMKKKNTFTDFINAGEFLIKENYTSKGHLYAMGGSAGGLLMGAVVNMAPELWNGIIAQVPFVDVVNTMLDESIPLTTNEFDEWGNPKNKEAYFYMKSYSPYENVAPRRYPSMLVMTGLHDSQVQYFEPAKWVAKLRATKKDNNVLLLKTDMKVGHGGASGRFDYLKDVALQYAFLLTLEGVTEKSVGKE